MDHYNHPVRARLRGLARNPAVPTELLRRLVDEQWKEVQWSLELRAEWTDEHFDTLAAHPDAEVRAVLAQALHITPEQRARFVEDLEFKVLAALALGPDYFLCSSIMPPPALPNWAYERLLERRPSVRISVAESPSTPRELRDRLRREDRVHEAEPADGPTLDRGEAQARARDGSEWVRADAAADPRLPADLVAELAVDPSAHVRLAVSMRPELSEQQRAAIDYHVAPEDRITPVAWATRTRDPEVQRRCAHSAHIGLRRGVACNPHLDPALGLVLAADDDFAVRLLLCENQAQVPSETVLTTYLQAQVITACRLLLHPSLQRVGLARLADSPDPNARALVRLDPDAPAELIERLSHDPEPRVRRHIAADRRLSPARVLELFDDPYCTEGAAANQHLPGAVMRRILADGGTLGVHVDEGTPAVYLGRWSPDRLPADD